MFFFFFFFFMSLLSHVFIPSFSLISSFSLAVLPLPSLFLFLLLLFIRFVGPSPLFCCLSPLLYCLLSFPFLISPLTFRFIRLFGVSLSPTVPGLYLVFFFLASLCLLPICTAFICKYLPVSLCI